MTKEERKEYMKVYNKNYRLKNRDKLNKASEEWNKKNAEYRKKYMDDYLEKHREERRAYDRKHYQENKDRIKKQKLAHYHKNKEEICRRKRLSFHLIKDQRTEYIRNKRRSDPYTRMVDNLRRRINAFFRSSGGKKPTNTTSLLGADYQTVKKHIEGQFTDGMNWGNHSLRGWHIDHIIPLCTAKNEEELLSLFHYTNLQPLWAKDNQSKNRANYGE